MKILLIVFISTLLSVSGIYILREKVFSVNDTAPEDIIISDNKFYNLSAKDIDGTGAFGASDVPLDVQDNITSVTYNANNDAFMFFT